MLSTGLFVEVQTSKLAMTLFRNQKQYREIVHFYALFLPDLKMLAWRFGEKEKKTRV